jgi:hypothetical protein
VIFCCTANVFGAPKADSGFTTYSGEGFSVSLPAKWNPSKEVEFPGQVLRYEDNFDQLSNLSVSILPTDKKSIKDYGSPEAFLKSVSSRDEFLFHEEQHEVVDTLYLCAILSNIISLGVARTTDINVITLVVGVFLEILGSFHLRSAVLISVLMCRCHICSASNRTKERLRPR